MNSENIAEKYTKYYHCKTTDTVLSLYHNCESTTILRHDYDEKLACSFFARVESRRMEAGARDTS